MLNHKSPVAAFVVDQVGIPLAEMIIRPAVDRMIEIVRSRIERQFVQGIEIEPRRSEQFAVGLPQNGQCLLDQFLIRPGAQPAPAM